VAVGEERDGLVVGWLFGEMVSRDFFSRAPCTHLVFVLATLT
jgi:hypothetical protein